MESALYGIYALVVFVSEILLVRCAHSFDFWYVNNSCVNNVRQHFPWSILYIRVSIYHHMLSNIVNPLQTPNHTNKQGQVSASLSKALCKCTQHCWPTTPNIVGCYVLHLFAHPAAFCWDLLHDVWKQSNFKLRADGSNNYQRCWESLADNVVSVCTGLKGL